MHASTRRGGRGDPRPAFDSASFEHDVEELLCQAKGKGGSNPSVPVELFFGRKKKGFGCEVSRKMAPVVMGGGGDDDDDDWGDEDFQGADDVPPVTPAGAAAGVDASVDVTEEATAAEDGGDGKGDTVADGADQSELVAAAPAEAPTEGGDPGVGEGGEAAAHVDGAALNEHPQQTAAAAALGPYHSTDSSAAVGTGDIGNDVGISVGNNAIADENGHVHGQASAVESPLTPTDERAENGPEKGALEAAPPSDASKDKEDKDKDDCVETPLPNGGGSGGGGEGAVQSDAVEETLALEDPVCAGVSSSGKEEGESGATAPAGSETVTPSADASTPITAQAQAGEGEGQGEEGEGGKGEEEGEVEQKPGTGGPPEEPNEPTAADVLTEEPASSPAVPSAAEEGEVEVDRRNTNSNSRNANGDSNGINNSGSSNGDVVADSDNVSNSANGSSGGGSGTPAPLVENAASLLLSAGRAVNELLEALLRRAEEAGDDRRKGNANRPSRSSAAAASPASTAAASATVGAAATAWGAVALALPLEAERLAGPLCAALSSPADRCSVETRLALLRAVAATVGPAAGEGEAAVAPGDVGVGSGVGVEGEAALAVKRAASALLRLLAPPSLIGLRIEVDRAAALVVGGGGGGGDAGREEGVREACLLEGVHVSQIAFKVRGPSVQVDGLTCVCTVDTAPFLWRVVPGV